MRILATMKRFPAGVMVIPLLLGCAMNTFFPNALTIGGFTSGLFKNGVPTLIGLFLFCSGATIDVKMAGSTVWKGVVLTALKFFIGFGLGLLLNALFGEAGFLGLAPLAVIGAVTNSNGVIYATLAGEFGDETDVGATSILALNDGPFFTMIALGASGMGNFPITDIIASIIPMVIGFIIGNLDHEWRKILATGMILLPPFNGFALGVQAVNPDAVVHVNKISTWGDENLERQAAQALIDTYDCCVIGQHCDSAQPQLVAAENNVFGCGYNSDMTEQAPNAHLTAAIWHWDVYYQAAIETAMTCGGAENFVTEMGGNAYYAGLSEGFVDASTLNELVAAPGTAAAMEAVRELIDSGEWDVFSGVKLNITVDAEAGTAAVEQVDAPLMSDGYELKDGEVVEMANPEIVPAGGASVTDDVIKSGMNYNVAGVVEG